MIGEFRASPYNALGSVMANEADFAISRDTDANVWFSDVEEAIAWLDGDDPIGQCYDDAEVDAAADCSSSASAALPRPTVCVDFDGVLNMYTQWQESDPYGPVRPGAFEFLDELHRRGYRVVICTARDSLDPVLRWLEDQHLLSAVEEVVVNRRPVAVAYIDNRAIRFEGDFAQTLADLDRLAPAEAC